MLVLRQINLQLEAGADIASEALTNDTSAQMTDVNPRYIMQLAGDGKFASDFTQIAGTSTAFALPLPQKYVTTNMLVVILTADQTVQVTTTGANGTSNQMVRAGLNQLGIWTQCGPVTGITVTSNSTATAVNVEWFMYELPAITTNAGWLDGPLATGLIAP